MGASNYQAVKHSNGISITGCFWTNNVVRSYQSIRQLHTFISPLLNVIDHNLSLAEIPSALFAIILIVVRLNFQQTVCVELGRVGEDFSDEI